MKTAAVILVSFVLAGCSMTPTQKKWTGAVVGVLVVGAIAAHRQDNGDTLTEPEFGSPGLPCTVQRDGSCR